MATLISQEKIAAKKVNAAIKIEQIKTRADIVAERKAERQARKIARIEARDSD